MTTQALIAIRILNFSGYKLVADQYHDSGDDWPVDYKVDRGEEKLIALNKRDSTVSGHMSGYITFKCEEYLGRRVQPQHKIHIAFSHPAFGQCKLNVGSGADGKKIWEAMDATNYQPFVRDVIPAKADNKPSPAPKEGPEIVANCVCAYRSHGDGSNFGTNEATVVLIDRKYL